VTRPAVSPEQLGALAGPEPEASPAAMRPPAVNGSHAAGDRAGLLRYARNYLAKVPAAVAGDHGHDRTFNAAAVLAVDFALDEAEAWPLLVEYNARCQPHWSEADARRKFREAAENGTHERGRLAQKYATEQASKNGTPTSAPQPTLSLPAVEGDRLFRWSSELRRLPPNDKWLWHGILSRGGVTLLSALWKAGKTTLLSHALKAFAAGGTVCGLEVKPARVLYVTEEDENTWAERRDELGLGDHVGWMCRPFKGRPSPLQWLEFLGKVSEQFRDHGFDVLAIDTLAKLWPVRDENDASQVDEALMPLWGVDPRAAVLLSHHLRKGDGAEATGSRGSGALTAFVETIVELRRTPAASCPATGASGRRPPS
jgi:hypothetical protein